MITQCPISKRVSKGEFQKFKLSSDTQFMMIAVCNRGKRQINKKCAKCLATGTLAVKYLNCNKNKDVIKCYPKVSK